MVLAVGFVTVRTKRNPCKGETCHLTQKVTASVSSSFSWFNNCERRY